MTYVITLACVDVDVMDKSCVTEVLWTVFTRATVSRTSTPRSASTAARASPSVRSRRSTTSRSYPPSWRTNRRIRPNCCCQWACSTALANGDRLVRTTPPSRRFPAWCARRRTQPLANTAPAPSARPPPLTGTSAQGRDGRPERTDRPRTAVSRWGRTLLAADTYEARPSSLGFETRPRVTTT